MNPHSQEKKWDFEKLRKLAEEIKEYTEQEKVSGDFEYEETESERVQRKDKE